MRTPLSETAASRAVSSRKDCLPQSKWLAPRPKTPAPTRFLLRVTGPYDSNELRQYSVSSLDGPYSSSTHCMSLSDHRG